MGESGLRNPKQARLGAEKVSPAATLTGLEEIARASNNSTRPQKKPRSGGTRAKECP